MDGWIKEVLESANAYFIERQRLPMLFFSVFVILTLPKCNQMD
jgi:hypothetical protein